MVNKLKKTILIIGSSSGIGYETAISSSDQFNVIATVRQAADLKRLNELSIKTYLLDMSDLSSINPTITKIFQDHMGDIDAIFINAGYGQPGALEDLPLEALKKQFDVNLFAPFEIAKSVIPFFRQRGEGKIIFNSSILGFISLPYRSAYNSSKHALESIASTLRLELKSTNIFISVIQPGPIDTKFRSTSFSMFDKYIDQKESHHQSQYVFMIDRLTSLKASTGFTLSPSSCSSVVKKIMLSPKPKNYYRITFPTKLFYWLDKILPSTLMDRLLYKSY